MVSLKFKLCLECIHQPYYGLQTTKHNDHHSVKQENYAAARFVCFKAVAKADVSIPSLTSTTRQRSSQLEHQLFIFLELFMIEFQQICTVKSSKLC